jgi:hypothetical protein
MAAAVFENSVDLRSSPEEVFDYCTDYMHRQQERNLASIKALLEG